METERHEIGMIGLGVMGRNMLLNMADHGFPVAGYDKDPGKVEALQKESAEHDIHGVANIKDFIGLLRRPRAIMIRDVSTNCRIRARNSHNFLSDILR